MKKSHSGLMTAGVVFFVAVVYSIILFLVKTSFDVASWILYGFTILSFIIVMLSCGMKMGRMAVFQIQQIAVTSVYFLVQFIVGGMILMAYELLPVTQVMVVEIVWTALYLAAAFLTGIIKSNANVQNENDRKSVLSDRELAVKLMMIANATVDETVKQSVLEAHRKLCNAFPVRSPELVPLQERIVTTVSMMEEAQEDRDNEAIQKYAEKLCYLIDERVMKAKIYAQ